MPALTHLQPRADGDASRGIDATAIGLLVGVVLIPCIILIWVVCFLFFAYPNDRNIFCMKSRKRKDPSDLSSIEQPTDYSQGSLHEKSTFPVPQHSYALHAGTESRNSGHLSKEQPRPGVSKFDTRMSLQSVASTNTVHGGVVQEPRGYV